MSVAPKKEKKKFSPVDFTIDLVTGGISGGVSKTLNAPLERVKLINQTNPGRYKGFVDCLVSLPKEEGFWAYWRGNWTNVARYFPTQALNFAFKDFFKNLTMPKGQNAYSYTEQFGRGLLSGGGAGAASLLFVYPLDLARTRMSTDLGKGKDKLYNGFNDVIKKTYAEGGARALYKGFNISVMGIIPYRAVYFGGYDTLKAIFLKDDPKPSFWKKWGLSQCNTIVAQTLTYPIDTIRRVLMLSGKIGKDGKPTPTFKSSWHCFTYIVKERGVAGLFRGTLANTYRATGGALCIVFYDTIQDEVDKARGIKRVRGGSSE